MTYEQWYAEVDRLIQAKYGIGVDDGVDWLSADAHEGGYIPAEGLVIWALAQGAGLRISHHR